MIRKPDGARRPANPLARPRYALLAGLLLAAPAAASAAGIGTPVISGLAWRSGSTGGGFPCVADMRARALDALVLFLAPPSFDEMVTNTAGWMRLSAEKAPLLVVSMALLPSDNKGQFAQCATGAFDGYFRQIGTNLQATGAQGVDVRLGWEANIGSRVHPWGVDSPDQVPAYVQCWRHAALALKAGGPAISVEWTNAKRTLNRALHVLDMYPGDDVVDVVGAHYYDTGPLKSTQAVWDQYYTATYNGGPWGLGTWLAFAQSRGKKLAGERVGDQAAGGPDGGAGGRPGVHGQHVPVLPGPRAGHRVRELLQRHHDQRRPPAVPEHRLPAGGRHVQGRLEPRPVRGLGRESLQPCTLAGPCHTSLANS